MSDLATYKANNALLFEKRVHEALNVARGGNTALVIVPVNYPKRAVVNLLVHLLQEPPDPLLPYLRATPDALHFEGTHGSVRIYPVDHIEWHSRQKRMMGYPAGIPTFLHPEVEGL